MMTTSYCERMWVEATTLRCDDLTDEALVDRVLRELHFILGRAQTPLETLVQRWPHALPQYRLGHEQRVVAAKEAARSQRVSLAGMAYDGVGIPASIGSGRRGAREILELLA